MWVTQSLLGGMSDVCSKWEQLVNILIIIMFKRSAKLFFKNIFCHIKWASQILQRWWS